MTARRAARVGTMSGNLALIASEIVCTSAMVRCVPCGTVWLGISGAGNATQPGAGTGTSYIPLGVSGVLRMHAARCRVPFCPCLVGFNPGRGDPGFGRLHYVRGSSVGCDDSAPPTRMHVCVWFGSIQRPFVVAEAGLVWLGCGPSREISADQTPKGSLATLMTR
jgi:hypothetical protein